MTTQQLFPTLLEQNKQENAEWWISWKDNVICEIKCHLLVFWLYCPKSGAIFQENIKTGDTASYSAFGFHWTQLGIQKFSCSTDNRKENKTDRGLGFMIMRSVRRWRQRDGRTLISNDDTVIVEVRSECASSYDNIPDEFSQTTELLSRQYISKDENEMLSSRRSFEPKFFITEYFAKRIWTILFC